MSSSLIKIEEVEEMNYLSRLQSVADQFTLINALEPGERPSQNAEGVLSGKYGQPGTLTVLTQSVGRYLYGDSTKKALAQIEKITKEAEKLLKRPPFTSRLELMVNFDDVSKATEQLSLALSSISEAAENGLKHYGETISSSRSNLVFRNEIEIQANLKTLRTIQEKITSLSPEFELKMQDYKRLQEIYDHKSYDAKEALKEQIDSLMNPKISDGLEGKKLRLETKIEIGTAREVFFDIFGENSVNDTMKLYFLDEQTYFDHHDIHALLLGIVANLTKEDIFAIIAKQEGSAYNKIQSLIPNQGQLKDSDLLDILAKLRSIEEPQPFKGKKYTNQLYGDSKFLHICDYNEAQYHFKASLFHGASKMTDLKHLGYTEAISREYVYALFRSADHQFRPGILFSIYDEKGEMRCREGHPLISKDSVHAFGICPVKDIVSDEENPKVKIAFRGTYDLGSLGRDINPTDRSKYIDLFTEGPGRLSFENNRSVLLEETKKFLEKCPESFDMEIMGHSLGATDTQRMYHALLVDMDKYPKIYSKIGNVNLYGYNAPGIEFDIAEETLYAIGNMPERQFHVRILVTKNDFISGFGQCYVGYVSEGLRPDNLKLTYLQMHHPDRMTEGDSLKEAGNGESLGEHNVLNRKVNAHTVPYFTDRYVKFNGVMNGCRLYNAFTNHQDDAAFIPQEVNILNQIDNEDKNLEDALINEIFTVGYHLDKKISEKEARRAHQNVMEIQKDNAQFRGDEEFEDFVWMN